MSARRELVDSSSRWTARANRWWFEEIEFDGVWAQVRYMDSGSVGAFRPWISYEAKAHFGGAEIHHAGHYLAYPQRRLREATTLSDGSMAEQAGRRRIDIHTSGGPVQILPEGLLGSQMIHRGDVVASFGAAYGPFEVPRPLEGRFIVECLLAVVASGTYRLVQRGRLLDRALLNVGSPFRTPWLHRNRR